jgi:thioester reductase-like protein
MRFLVTGATGLAGAEFVLASLNEPGIDRIYVVCRSVDRWYGTVERHQRLKGKLRYDPAAADRLRIIHGDLTLERFGLDEAAYRRLADDIDQIYHFACDVNWLKSLEQLHESNVAVPQRLIELAALGRDVSFNFASSLVPFAFDPEKDIVAETETPDPACAPNGYSLSKIKAERVGLAARAGGQKINIFRSDFIVPHMHERLILPHSQFFIRVLCSLARSQELFPEIVFLDALPADTYARLTLALGLKDRSRTYHLLSRDFITNSDLKTALETHRYEPRMIPFVDWRDRIFRRRSDRLQRFSDILGRMDEAWFARELRLKVSDSNVAEDLGAGLEGILSSKPPKAEILSSLLANLKGRGLI